MRNIENRIGKIEEVTGQKRKDPDKLIFQVIGENGEIIETKEIEIKYEKN